MSPCWQSGLSQSKINKIELFENHPLTRSYVGRSEMEKCLFWRQLNVWQLVQNFPPTKAQKSNRSVSFNQYFYFILITWGIIRTSLSKMCKCNWHKNFYNVTMVCLFCCDCMKLIGDYFYGIFESNERWFVSNK